MGILSSGSSSFVSLLSLPLLIDCPMSSTPETIAKFVQFCQQHIKGDEKGEAQVFLDRFFRAFGYEGAIEAGATYEERVKKVLPWGKGIGNEGSSSRHSAPQVDKDS